MAPNCERENVFLLIKKTELMMIKGKREKKQAGFDER